MREKEKRIDRERRATERKRTWTGKDIYIIMYSGLVPLPSTLSPPYFPPLFYIITSLSYGYWLALSTCHNNYTLFFFFEKKIYEKKTNFNVKDILQRYVFIAFFFHLLSRRRGRYTIEVKIFSNRNLHGCGFQISYSYLRLACSLFTYASRKSKKINRRGR